MKPRKLDNKLLYVIVLAFLDVAGMAEEPVEVLSERRDMLWFLSPFPDN